MKFSRDCDIEGKIGREKMAKRSQKRDASKTNRQLSLITDRPESANRDSAETRRRP